MSEIQLQAEIFQYFHNNYCLKNHHPRCCIFAVPNGGTRNKFEAMQLKSSGLLAGVSDLIIVIPNKILFIELKIDKGIQSDKQKDFQSTVNLLGFEYIIIRSLEEFKQYVLKHINN